MDRERLRSPLARAIGLGSAKEGVEQWWMERVTAVALVPLTVWFAASVIGLSGSDYADLHRVAEDSARHDPHGAAADRAFLSHSAWPSGRHRGLRHSGARIAALMAVRLGCFALAIAGIVATLRIAFSG